MYSCYGCIIKVSKNQHLEVKMLYRTNNRTLFVGKQILKNVQFQ